MKTIVLGGYSHKNKEWADTVAQKLQNAEVFPWKHWSDVNIKFLAKEEEENLKAKIGDSEVNIIAKSIGTLVAAMTLKGIKFGKVILCGIPINDINEDELREYNILNDIGPKKIIVFQNSEDEHGKFEEVRNFLSQINPEIKIIEKPGNTHDYPYYEDFIQSLQP